MPELVVAVLDDRRHRTGDADAVRTHGDGDELAVLVEHPQVEHFGKPASELEDVTDLDATRDRQRLAAPRALVVVAHFGRLDDAVGGEVASGDQIDHVATVLVSAGDPARSVDDSRVDQVTDT